MVYVIFIIPVLIMVIGFWLYKFPPKKPNWFIGYRSRKSIKNKKVWKKANQYCGKQLVKMSFLMFVMSFILFIMIQFKIIKFSEILLLVVVVVEICLLILVGLDTENNI